MDTIIISYEQRDSMLAAQDEAAQEFWEYPDAQWQFNFQAGWLERHFGVSRAKTPDGLVWGELWGELWGEPETLNPDLGF